MDAMGGIQGRDGPVTGDVHLQQRHAQPAGPVGFEQDLLETVGLRLYAVNEYGFDCLTVPYASFECICASCISGRGNFGSFVIDGLKFRDRSSGNWAA